MPQTLMPGIFTVSRLNQSVRQLLEQELGQIWVSGEISNFSQPASGHWYFTLKDDGAQIRCAMFRNANRRMTFRPQHGQQVLVRANVTLYEPRGDYQIIAESMQPAGEGLLQQQFEQLKQRLADEGLFAAEKKKPLPSPARRPGVITSPSGAALHDVLHILRRRDPSLPVVIYPTSVQGADASLQIVRAIEIANQRAECDVLIVGRGGGSLEDLWCFNDERVARAIFTSQIPIVSAIGHETDITIADFVADLRAPTPSAAAEIISRDRQELARQLIHQQQRLEMAMDYLLARQLNRYTRLRHRLEQQHPQLRLSRQQTALMRLDQRMKTALETQMRGAGERQLRLSQRLMQRSPQMRIQRLQSMLQQLEFRLLQSLNYRLGSTRERFAHALTHLEAVSPLATMARGYSVTRNAEGQVIKHIEQLAPGDSLTSRLIDGTIESTVIRVIPERERQNDN